MFFKKHIKQREELGDAGLEMIKRCFEGSCYLHENTFHPPQDIFDDLYIRGFFVVWFGHLIDFAFDGGEWSTEKRGACVKAAMLSMENFGIITLA